MIPISYHLYEFPSFNLARACRTHDQTFGTRRFLFAVPALELFHLFGSEIFYFCFCTKQNVLKLKCFSNPKPFLVFIAQVQ